MQSPISLVRRTIQDSQSKGSMRAAHPLAVPQQSEGRHIQSSLPGWSRLRGTHAGSNLSLLLPPHSSYSSATPSWPHIHLRATHVSLLSQGQKAHATLWQRIQAFALQTFKQSDKLRTNMRHIRDVL